MQQSTSAGFAMKIRAKLQKCPGMFAKLASAIGDAGGDIGEVTVVSENRNEVVRDITITTGGLDHEKKIAEAVEKVTEIEVVSEQDGVFAMHEGGKIEVTCRYPVTNPAGLAMAYTPGVARVCLAISDDTKRARDLTIKGNTVAVVSDGTAVLGLGDIGPEGAMPVMEGKAMLFKAFGGVDAFPICLNTKEPDEIVAIVKALAPTFGGINLEDISAPRCFEIEERLKAELDIPVFHDDQHGTAVVMLAGLVNALKIVGKKAEDLKVVVCGVGAAGVACSKIMIARGIKNIIGCDRLGAIYKGRTENMNSMKEWYAENTNPEGVQGGLREVMKDADVFIGLSSGGLLDLDHVKSMAKDPIIFAMANPDPEIKPEDAAGHVAVMATGRSDYPNQINNVLAFPGIFRGAFDCAAKEITQNMKLAAAEAIAQIAAENLSPEHIIPSPFETRVAPAVAEAVKKAAEKDGVCGSSESTVPGFKDLAW